MNVSNVDFILVEPVEAGNVGSAARALKNMGFDSLTLVNPQFVDLREARKMAVHAKDLLESARQSATLEEAIQPAAWVVGLSCRLRVHQERKIPYGPKKFIAELSRLPAGARAALVFGPEPTGLTNAHLGLCQEILTLPTAADYPSMNLAQAVMLVAWEIRRAQLDSDFCSISRETTTAGELEGLINHLKQTLANIDYLDPQNPELILNDLRKVLSRAEMDPRELRMIRGIFHRMDVWIARHGGQATPNQPRGKKK
ncbi:MAG: RNA methyltransferase [Deltaproteobacteria bacterium]|nr:RNA methyltransferase [Deltaproteobacteria bacterium]MBW1871126.1 RNA methyltransferase [Deltaproteobacteria bacterium]